MAKISQDLDVLLRYAEKRGYCCYLCLPDDNQEKDRIFEDWEDMLWDPAELRSALEDYPDQPRAGEHYPSYSYPFDINDLNYWIIVDPSDLFERFMRKVDKARHEAEQLNAYAQHFKRVWIEKTESNIEAYNNKQLQAEIDQRLEDLKKKGMS